MVLGWPLTFLWYGQILCPSCCGNTGRSCMVFCFYLVSKSWPMGLLLFLEQWNKHAYIFVCLLKPYLPLLLGQTGVSTQCRPRSDAFYHSPITYKRQQILKKIQCTVKISLSQFWERNLLWSTTFPFRVDPVFRTDLVCMKANRMSQKLSLLWKKTNTENRPNLFSPFTAVAQPSSTARSMASLTTDPGVVFDTQLGHIRAEMLSMKEEPFLQWVEVQYCLIAITYVSFKYLIQYNLNGSNTDGSFIVDESNSFFQSLQNPSNSSRKQIFNDFFLFYHAIVCCVYSLESPHRGDSNEYTQHTIIV